MILEKLKQKFEDLTKKGISEDVIVIAFKEDFQHHILHFIYTSKKYYSLVMYGGTVLRIGYKLPRMSEDLDFQTTKKIDLEEFAENLKKYFQDNHNLKIEVKCKNDGNGTSVIFVKFDILKNFEFKSINWSKLQIRIDINLFKEGGGFLKNIIPVATDTLVYTIQTYPLSTLMASKTVAFLTRDTRGIGRIVSNVKPRDVYDMMWYMNQRIMPDLEYLQAYGFEMSTFLDFRDKVKSRVEIIQENAFRNDLSQFFLDEIYFGEWLGNWRVKFLHLLNSYEVFEVGDLRSIYFREEFDTNLRKIVFKYNCLDNSQQDITFEIKISNFWFDFKNTRITKKHRLKKLESFVFSSHKKITELDHEYIGLFYKKVENYIKRSKGVVYQNSFTTKIICATGDKLNPKTQLCLNKVLLEKIQFEELL